MDGDYAASFYDEDTRKSFIAKVFTIITVQLFFTIGVVCAFIYIPEVQQFAKQNSYLVWVCLAVTFVIMMAMACCESVRRTSPLNCILLTIFTIAESFLMGFLTSHYNPQTILLALGITTLVCMVLIIFAIQTTCDFTTCGGLLIVLFIILLILGIVGIFYRDKIYLTIYASVGVFVFSFYLIFDIQLLMGDRENALDEDEYIFAALTIYVDIIQMFRYILLLLGLWEE